MLFVRYRTKKKSVGPEGKIDEGRLTAEQKILLHLKG